MRRNYFYHAILTLALLLAGASAAFAQSAPLRGLVTLRGADGKETPLADAQIDVYRTDLPGKYNTKTNKKGEFAFAGLPLTGTYIIAASAPNASPDILPGVRPSETEYKLTLGPGDGKRLTDVEAKAAAKGGKGGGAAPGPAKGESAEDKKKREEQEAKNKEIMAKNTKIEASNAVLNRTFKAGGDALNAGNAALSAKNYAEAKTQYTTAIAQYDEGLAADAEQPALLTNKAVALKGRGVAAFNASTSITDDVAKSASLEAARNDFRASAEAATKAVDMLKAQTPPTEAAAQTSYNNNKFAAVSVRSECMRLFVTKVDATQIDAAVAAYQEYMAAETDPAKKAKAQLDLAGMVFDAAGTTFTLDGFNRAMAEYQKVLAAQPDNPDALMRSGLILFNIGLLQNNDKAKYQEAANYLKLFMEKAPAGVAYDQFKREAQEVLDNLKAQQNVKPEKTTPAKRKG